MQPRGARYYRTYYKFQGILEKDFLHLFKDASSGGVRKASTLPPGLNKRAHELTEKFLDEMDLRGVAITN